MDLDQNKLSRQEWNNLETKVSSEEQIVLNILDKGYNNDNLSINKTLSLNEILKIDVSESIDKYLYNKYFKKTVDDINKKYGLDKKDYNHLENIKLQKIKSADMVRLQNIDSTIEREKDIIFENNLIQLYKNMLKYFKKNDKRYICCVYTILQLFQTNIKNINEPLKNIVNYSINLLKPGIKLKDVINESYTFIERNPLILDFQDIELFQHQKEVYKFYKNKNKSTASLVLYKAPTGTGKTLTPIGLSNQYKIIFVCVARHIGLALAKSSISTGKKIAFAFGCETEQQIRLHNFAAKSYMKHTEDTNPKKVGEYIKFKDGSRKIDNSDGSDVQIMICDVKSYLVAMNYMTNFNKNEDIITFWDEPTITLDSATHNLHTIISNNWHCNTIPNLVLSCATLPEQNDIVKIIDNFKQNWGNDTIIKDISSFDCKKSIPLINKDLKYVNIHTLYNNQEYDLLVNCIKYVRKNYTLLRYLELNSIIDFINSCNKHIVVENRLKLENYFNNDLTHINMNSIKMYYLDLIDSLSNDQYETVYLDLKERGILDKLAYDDKTKGVQFTTSDAYTLTDGPTIFLCEDVNKIGSFYIQQSKIPQDVFKSILAKITKNEKITNQINDIEKLIACKEEKNARDDGEESTKIDNEDKEWYNNINKLRKQIMLITLDSKYVPNTTEHQKEWCNNVSPDRFIPQIDDLTTKEIMSLNIDNNLKVLLLLGIGVFMKHSTIDYTEFMKKLAINQKLFIIIASSDYIYGTNYQFCHGIISKDLNTMTQQKTLQSLGRVGRNKIQQNYSVRFRDNSLIYKIFNKDTNSIEADNMNRLFS